tara:strand:+ start:1004 stop:1342 length:339 start_codon:yes stop_codon:yes gene_type:complete
MAQKHVFPLFLDASPEFVAGSGTLVVPITTSMVRVSPTASDVSFTVADGTIPGQILVIFNEAVGNDANITFATPLVAAADVVALDNTREQVTAMWNGSAWVILGGLAPTTVS